MKVAGRRDSGSRKHNAAARAQVRDDGDPQLHCREPQRESALLKAPFLEAAKGCAGVLARGRV